MQINPLTQLYKDFLTILDQAVVKFAYEGDKRDDVNMRRDADGYMIAVNKEDVFETYIRYDTEVLMEALGITDEDQVKPYQLNRELIPYGLRNVVLVKQRNYIINNYVEKNNYYRMLNGLPDYESTPLDYIYVDHDICEVYSIPEDVPIHEIDSSFISLLSNIGYLQKVIDANPDKKYLKYLGTNKIDITTARRANGFALLRVPTSISESLLSSFTMIYEQCREYFMSCIYIPQYRDTMSYYDNFIGLCIMIMTIQQILARIIKNTTDRDFFDPYCAKLLFNAYGVPYNPNLDANTRNRLVQNLNLLVMNKGTSKVIYDIGSLLGYSKIELFKYYLMKVRRFDSQGVPVVYYKPGTQELDYEKMYEVYFQKVYIDDQDFYSALTDSNNKVPYIEITEEDPFWVEDEALNKELYESEYNYVETKYMGVSISYRLSQILLQNVYLLRMILDKKNEISNIRVDVSKITSSGMATLFDVVMTLCAMTCKQNGLEGELITRFTHILHVMGFSFEKDFPLIKETILNDPYLDDSLVDFFNNPYTYTIDQFNELYDTFLRLHDHLMEVMSTTQDIRVYQAYRKFYDSIFYTKENQEIFNVGTPSEPIYPRTYLEYLQYANPEIHELIENTNKDDMYVYIEYILAKLTEILPELHQAGSSTGASNTLETLFMQLIRFFKSYTTDIINLTSIYIFDLKPSTLIRLIETIDIHKNMQVNDDLYLAYADSLHYISTTWYSTAILISDQIYEVHKKLALNDGVFFADEIYAETANIVLRDILNHNREINPLVDVIYSLNNKFGLDDYFRLFETIYISNDIDLRDILNKRRITLVDDYTIRIHGKGRDELFLTDANKTITNTHYNEYRLLRMRERYKFLSMIYDKDDTLKFFEMVKSINEAIYLNEYDGVLIDILHNRTISFSLEDYLYFIDKMKWISNVYGKDAFANLSDLILHIAKNLAMHDDNILTDLNLTQTYTTTDERLDITEEAISTSNISGESDELPIIDEMYRTAILELSTSQYFTDKEQISNSLTTRELSMLTEDSTISKIDAIKENIDVLNNIAIINSSINSKDNLPITDIEKHSTSFNVNGNLCKLSDECKISFSD